MDEFDRDAVGADDGVFVIVRDQAEHVVRLVQVDARCIGRGWPSGDYVIAHLPDCRCPSEILGPLD